MAVKVVVRDGYVVPGLVTTICADFEPTYGEVVVAVKVAAPLPCDVVQPVKLDSKPPLVRSCAGKVLIPVKRKAARESIVSLAEGCFANAILRATVRR